MAWQEFEEECLEYLRKKYPNSAATFELKGNHNSTVSDIFVTIHNHSSFYIDVKEPIAQSGQFVLFSNNTTRQFEYSKKNETKINPYSQEIMAYMDKFYDEFVSAGTTGLSLDMDPDIFCNWIKKHYQEKGAEFFMSKGKNGYVIFPLDKINEYFDVSAKYRIKKSGSSNLSAKDRTLLPTIISQLFINKYSIFTDGKKTYVETEANINRKKVSYGEYTYYFNKSSHNSYVVTRLSNTRNLNVIFTVALKQEQNLSDLKVFENRIKA